MKTLALYMPYKIEFLFDFFELHNIKTNETYTQKKKDKVFITMRKMLSQDVIHIGEYDKIGKFNKWNLPIDDIIYKLNCVWPENISYPEFYSMAWFSYTDWYIQTLQEIGYSEQVNWREFVQDKIGNLEVWIEEKRPKNINKK